MWRHYHRRMSESLVRAFPARLAPVVTDVAARIPEAQQPPSGPVTETGRRTWPGLVVAGEPVVIPYRIYNPEPAPGFIAGLSRLEKVVAAGIYSRHHNGFVRQRWLGTLLDADEPWVAPFIIQLLGEYVVPICRDIERFAQRDWPADSPLHQHLPAFLHDNPCFAELTRQRAISYNMGHALVALSILSGRSV
jgi:hypothetical protein